MNKIILYIIAVCFFLLYSCSKDKDLEKPSITISSPVDLQQINGGDIIKITGIITDNRHIERVTITLRDKNNYSILSTISKSPSKSESMNYSLNIDYSFDDLQLVSGQYDFNITVSDGENTSTEYIPIVFNEFEKQRKGVFIIGNNGNFSNIYLLENDFNSNFYKSINGDFIGAAIDLDNQQLINSGKSDGSISAIETLTGNEIWSLPVLGNTSTPYYTGFYYYDQTVFLGKRNGGVQAYDQNGNPKFSSETLSGLFMESAFIHNDEYFVMEEKPIVVNSVSYLSLSWLYSGSRVQQTLIDSDIKGMYSLNANTIILLANDASLNAKVIFYDIPLGGKSTPFNINSLGKIDDCLEVSNGIYLVTASGNLTFVNINNFSTLGYLNGVPAEKLWFDNLANELYITNGNLLSIYDYSSRTLKGSYTHTEEIEEVLFWYNK